MRGGWRVLIGAALGLACSDAEVGGGASNGAGSHGGSDGTPGTTRTDTGPTGVTMTGASSTGDASTSAGEEDEGGAFLPRPDLGEGSAYECDPIDQDCPAGLKCTYVQDGMPWTQCVPVAPDPKQPGETCTVTGPIGAGLDDCQAGATCHDVWQDTGQGVCRQLCYGGGYHGWEYRCSDPWSYCRIWADGSAVCLPLCDPLDPDPCEEGYKCTFDHTGPTCVYDSGEPGAYGDPCGLLTDCDPGLICLTYEAVPGCMGPAGCCSPYCDLRDPEADAKCPGAPQQRCLPLEEDRPPAVVAHVGYCAVPQ